MNNYHLQNGCWNCIYRLNHQEWDYVADYYCGFDGLMNLDMLFQPAQTTDKYEQEGEIILKHLVDESGICDCYINDHVTF
jgi:hypothetical protein